MNWNHVKRIGLSYYVAVCATLLIHPSANATPTPVLSASCIWSGDDGLLFRQSCQLVGNSSAGSGTVFSITWEDGVSTRIRDRFNTGNFVSLPSEEKVWIYGEYEFGRMLFPRQITIEGKGTIHITYENS
jgi:hypothetical protein